MVAVLLWLVGGLLVNHTFGLRGTKELKCCPRRIRRFRHRESSCWVSSGRATDGDVDRGIAKGLVVNFTSMSKKSFFEGDVIPTAFTEMNQWEEIRDFHYELGSKYEQSERTIVNNVYTKRGVYLLRMAERMNKMQEVYSDHDSMSLLAQPTRLFVEACLSLFAPKDGWPKGQIMVGQQIKELRKSFRDSPNFLEFLNYCESLNSISKAELHEHKPHGGNRHMRDANKASLVDTVFLAAAYVKINFERSPRYQSEQFKRRKLREESVEDTHTERIGISGCDTNTSDCVDHNDKVADRAISDDAWISEMRQQVALVIQEKTTSVAEEQAQWADVERRRLEETIEKRRLGDEQQLQAWIKVQEGLLQRRIDEEVKRRKRAAVDELQAQREREREARLRVVSERSRKEDEKEKEREKERKRQQKLAEKKSKRSEKSRKSFEAEKRGLLEDLEAPWTQLFGSEGNEVDLKPYLVHPTIRKKVEGFLDIVETSGQDIGVGDAEQTAQAASRLRKLWDLDKGGVAGNCTDATEETFSMADVLGSALEYTTKALVLQEVKKYVSKSMESQGYSYAASLEPGRHDYRYEYFYWSLVLWETVPEFVTAEISRSEMSCFGSWSENNPSDKNLSDPERVLEILNQELKLRKFEALASGVGPVVAPGSGELHSDPVVRLMFLAVAPNEEVADRGIVSVITWSTATADVMTITTKAAKGDMEHARNFSTYFCDALRECSPPA